MSSKKAVYESSMLLDFGADDELVESGFTVVGAAGLMATAVVEVTAFGFGLGIAASLLTRTEAGT